MVFLLFLFSLSTQALLSAETFHYYSFTQNRESLQTLIEREFVVSKKKEVNYAFYLKVMKQNARLKNFDQLPKDQRIYFRLPKVILKDEDKSKVSLPLNQVPKFSVDELVTDQEVFDLELKLNVYLQNKNRRKQEEARLVAERLKERGQQVSSRSPASIKSNEPKRKSIHDFLREEEEFIMQNNIQTD